MMPFDTAASPPMSRAWYDATIDSFRRADASAIVGELVRNGSFDVLQTQSEAWREQIHFLRALLTGLDGYLLFEFSIPRMGKRVDVVLLVGAVIFVVEFKVGAKLCPRG